jgi:hypothetical protein
MHDERHCQQYEDGSKSLVSMRTKGHPAQGKQGLLFKKRSKNVRYLVRALRQGTHQREKVFWFFFSKKNCLPTFIAPPTTRNTSMSAPRPCKRCLTTDCPMSPVCWRR